MHIPSLVCVSDALRISSSLSSSLRACATAALTGEARRDFCLRHTWKHELGRVHLHHPPTDMSLLIQDPVQVAGMLSSLLTSIPPGWKSPPPLPPPLPSEPGGKQPSPPYKPFMRHLSPRLGWLLPPSPAAPPQTPGGPVTLTKFKVKLGSALQSGDHVRSQSEARATYVGHAWGPPYSIRYIHARTRVFAGLLPTLWSIHWENKQKEVLWRLAADGIRGASSRIQFRCPCSSAVHDTDPRLHSFWTCPVAVAVRDALQASLDAASPQPGPLQRASLWLCTARPCSSIDLEVWRVVCLAALSAMDHGRRQLWRLSFAAARDAPRDPNQRTLYQVWGIPPPPSVPLRSITDRAGSLAVADFWARIADFVDVCNPPLEWEDTVGPDHPFISHGGAWVNMRSPPSALTPISDDQHTTSTGLTLSSPSSSTSHPHTTPHTYLPLLPEDWPYI